MAVSSPRGSPPRVGVFHCTLTGAAVLAAIFLLCWATEAIADIPASQSLLVFFTGQALRSHEAMAKGCLLAISVGALVGALIAIFFNVFSALGMGARNVAPYPVED